MFDLWDLAQLATRGHDATLQECAAGELLILEIMLCFRSPNFHLFTGFLYMPLWRHVRFNVQMSTFLEQEATKLLQPCRELHRKPRSQRRCAGRRGAQRTLSRSQCNVESSPNYLDNLSCIRVLSSTGQRTD